MTLRTAFFVRSLVIAIPVAMAWYAVDGERRLVNKEEELRASVATDIARLGGAQNTLNTLDTNHANVSLSNKQAQLSVGQLDYGDAAVKLNGYTSALQATQKAYGKIANLSLFDVI